MASSVFIQVGQCGNQLGSSFWEEAIDHWKTENKKKQGTTEITSKRPNSSLSEPPRLPYELLDGTLPCVLVDTEPRVVRRCAGKALFAGRLHHKSLVTETRGRGNNWAYGYSATSQEGGGGGIVEKVRMSVRRVAEACDSFTGCVVFHSIAGGTGSGLTSRLLEDLRAEFPAGYILCVTVAPFSSGETPLQHYNSSLSLSWLQKYADCVILIQNDSVAEQMQKMTGACYKVRESQQPGFSMEGMNAAISSCLCNSLLPLRGKHTALGRFTRPLCIEPCELTRSLCADHSLKLISPSHISLSKSSLLWEDALSRILPHKQRARGHYTHSALLISRGSPSSVAPLMSTAKEMERRIKLACNTVEWNPFPVDFWFSQEPALQEAKHMSLLSNTSSVTPYLNCVLEKSEKMLQAKAYLHWYQRYGIETETLESAFDNLRTIIDSYNNLNCF